MEEERRPGPIGFLSDRVVARLSWLSAAEQEEALADEDPPTEIGFGLGDAVVGGRFRIGERIGAGGMGTVYRAVDLETGNEVALKVPHFADPRNDVRFELESRALAALGASGLVGYVGHRGGDEPFLAMPLVSGMTLAKRLVAGALPEGEAVAVVRRIASGVAALHVSGWVHRDIKPGNVIIDGEGAPKLIDLGLVREIDGAGSGTKTGDLVGTLSYMAPEQLTGARVVDARTDVFALGCVLYECLAGKNAFRRTTMQVAERMLTGADEPVPHPREEGIGAPLSALIDSMLMRDPARRPRDAVELLVRLAELEDQSGPSHSAVHSMHGRELRLALATLLRSSLRVAATPIDVGYGFALSAASLLAELIAPADVVVLRADPAHMGEPGAHVEALAACLTMLGHRGLSTRLRGGRGVSDGAGSVIVVIDGAEWLDTQSMKTVRAIADEGRMRVLATTLDGSALSEWPLVWLAPTEPSVEPTSPKKSIDRWVLRCAATLGRRFTPEGIASMVDGPERELVSSSLESLADEGFVTRPYPNAPYCIPSTQLLARIRSEMRKGDLRVGEAIAREHRRLRREPGGPSCFVLSRTTRACLSPSAASP